MKRYALFAFTIVLAACAATASKVETAGSCSETFQLHTGPDGRVYRIDTRTGKTNWLDGSTYREIAEQTMPQLVVGKVYKAEDGHAAFRYDGNGKLEPWGLDRYYTGPKESDSKK